MNNNLPRPMYIQMPKYHSLLFVDSQRHLAIQVMHTEKKQQCLRSKHMWKCRSEYKSPKSHSCASSLASPPRATTIFDYQCRSMIGHTKNMLHGLTYRLYITMNDALGTPSFSFLIFSPSSPHKEGGRSSI